MARNRTSCFVLRLACRRCARVRRPGGHATQFDAAPGAASVSLDQWTRSASASRSFGLWTRSVVASLIEQKFPIRLGVTAVGALLPKLGLTAQKTLQRAYKRDPEPRWADGRVVCHLAQTMMRHRSKPVHLVVDGLPANKTRW